MIIIIIIAVTIIVNTSSIILNSIIIIILIIIVIINIFIFIFKTHHRVEAFLCHLLYFHAESSRPVDSWRRTTAATGKTRHLHHHHHQHHLHHHHNRNRHNDHIHHYHHYVHNYIIIDLGPIHFRSSWISRQWWSNPSWYDIHVDNDEDDDNDSDDEDNADSIVFDSNHYLSCQVLSISLMQHVFLILSSWLHLMRWGARVLYEE